MPNFNGAIIVHALQLLDAPATLREIVVSISKNTQLPQDELKMPVKQTLDMGHRLGFLQKLNGRYFLVPMTFQTLMNEMQALDTSEKFDKTKPVKSEKKLLQKRCSKSVLERKISKKEISKDPVAQAKAMNIGNRLQNGTNAFIKDFAEPVKPIPVLPTKLKRSK
ncbi:hypothetical protein KR018_003365 [Drosophila ironensis]|nr:hypothetical protein KR018_003365 [Drosophila ironensis]